MSFIAIFIVAVIVSTVALIPKTYAATKSWDGGGGDNKFSTAANWSGNAVPANGDSIVFDITSLSSETTLNNDMTGLSLSGISIVGNNATDAYEITGNSLTISGSVSDDRTVIANGNYGVLFKLPMVMSADTTFAGINFENGSVDTNGHQLTLQGLSSPVTEYAAAGVVSGSGALSVTGSGAFLLANNASYTGGITVSSGASLFTDFSGVQQSSQITVNGGTLEVEELGTAWGSPVTLSMPMSLSGTLYAYQGYADVSQGDTSGGAGTLTLSGGVTLNGDLTYLGGDSSSAFGDSAIDTTIDAPFTANGHTITTSPNSLGTITYPTYTVPDAPTGLSATPGSGHVALTWTAPVSDGGQSITDYIVQYRTHPNGSWTTFNDGTSTTPSADVTGLTNGTAYDFQVMAVNSVGNSTSDVISNVTPTAAATVSSAVTNLAATPGDSEAGLTWDAPGSDGGSSINDYQVQYKLSSGSTWTTFNDGTSTTTGAVVTGLTNGNNYDFRVAAINGVGTSAYSTVTGVAVAAPVVVPSAPLNLAATPASTQAGLTWDVPSSNGGASITDYQVQYKLSSGSTWTTFNDGTSTTTSTTVTGLTDGNNYDFRVAAVNSAGTGSYDVITGIAISASVTAPGPVSNLATVPGVSQVALTWDAPSSNGGSPITDYTVQYKASTDSSWTTFNDGVSTTTSATVTGLSSGTSYDFSVAAVNGAGSSTTQTTTASTTTPSGGGGGGGGGTTVANAPTAAIGTVDAITHALTLSWSAPSSNGGAPITDYLIEYTVSGQSNWATLSHPAITGTSYTVTSGLTQGQTYDFRISAINSAGTGPALLLSNYTYTVPVPTGTVTNGGTSVVGVPNTALFTLPSSPVMMVGAGVVAATIMLIGMVKRHSLVK